LVSEKLRNIKIIQPGMNANRRESKAGGKSQEAEVSPATGWQD